MSLFHTWHFCCIQNSVFTFWFLVFVCFYKCLFCLFLHLFYKCQPLFWPPLFLLIIHIFCDVSFSPSGCLKEFPLDFCSLTMVVFLCICSASGLTFLDLQVDLFSSSLENLCGYFFRQLFQLSV